MSNRTNYDKDLQALKGALAAMGEAAAGAVENAIQALAAADPAAAAQTAAGDDQIDAMERDIQHRCMTLLLRQQPVGSDLRHISAALKVVTDLERIGDHAADIADIVPHLCDARRAGDAAVSHTVRMAQDCHRMILDAMQAFLAADEAAAKAVIAADDRVDDAFTNIKHIMARELAADPTLVDEVLDLLMVVKYLERLGDHAVNIAEWVEFLHTGLYRDQSLF